MRQLLISQTKFRSGPFNNSGEYRRFREKYSISTRIFSWYAILDLRNAICGGATVADPVHRVSPVIEGRRQGVACSSARAVRWRGGVAGTVTVNDRLHAPSPPRENLLPVALAGVPGRASPLTPIYRADRAEARAAMNGHGATG
jgi:hypothetical protein